MAEPSIDFAIANVVRNIAPNNTKANYEAWLLMYGQAVAAPLDNRVVRQRTVTNWLVPSLEVKDRLPAAGSLTNQKTELVIDIVFRTLNAVRDAFAAGRISAAQEQMVLDQYNLAWP